RLVIAAPPRGGTGPSVSVKQATSDTSLLPSLLQLWSLVVWEDLRRGVDGWEGVRFIEPPSPPGWLDQRNRAGADGSRVRRPPHRGRARGPAPRPASRVLGGAYALLLDPIATR